MPIEFIIATLDDLHLIVETYNATIPSLLVTADLEPVSVESRIEWFKNHQTNSRPLWKVIYNNQYAGWVSLNSFYGRPAYNGTVETSIYLEQKFHNKGLGKICLQKIIDEAPNLNVHTLLGFIFGRNEISLNLFYKFGFQKWAQLPKVANMKGFEEDLLILGKKV